MKALAKGVNSDSIFKLIKVTLSTQQGDYAAAVEADTTGLNDIADELEVESPLFTQEETKKGDSRPDLDYVVEDVLKGRLGVK